MQDANNYNEWGYPKEIGEQMAVEAICDKCDTREENIHRYILGVTKRDIPRNEKPVYPFQTYTDGIIYMGPEFQVIVDLCETCHREWQTNLIEAMKVK